MSNTFDTYYFGLAGVTVILAGFNLSQYRKDGLRRIALAIALIFFGGVCLTLALHTNELITAALGAITFVFLVADFALRLTQKGKPRR